MQHGGQAQGLSLESRVKKEGLRRGTDGGLFVGCGAPWDYLRSVELDDDLAGFGLGRPTNIPPIRANESMAWFIFDSFMAASPRHSR